MQLSDFLCTTKYNTPLSQSKLHVGFSARTVKVLLPLFLSVGIWQVHTALHKKVTLARSFMDLAKLKGRLDFSHQPVVACLPVVIGNLCDVIFNDVSLKTT